jgi:hypothetical protein
MSNKKVFYRIIGIPPILVIYYTYSGFAQIRHYLKERSIKNKTVKNK